MLSLQNFVMIWSPEDEILNGSYYGVSRISKIELANSLMELGEIKLSRTPPYQPQ